MLALGAAWPDAVPVADLGGEPLYGLLLQAYAANLVQLHVWAPQLATTPSERPIASALARLQATEGTRVTNLRHATVEVTDDLGRHLIRLLDGTRDRPALLHELGRPADELDRSLTGLAAAALLEASPVASSPGGERLGTASEARRHGCSLASGAGASICARAARLARASAP